MNDITEGSPTKASSPPEVTDHNVADLKNRTGPTTSDTTQALVKHYTDQFWSGISKTNTTLLAWAAALLLITFTVLAPLSGKLNQATKKLSRIERLKAERNDKIDKRIKASGGPDEAATARLRIAIEEYDKEIKAAKKKYQEDLVKVQEVPLPPPLNKLNIGIPYIPLAWTILFAGLLSFFLYRRTVALGTLAQIVHIYLIENRRRLRDIRGLASWAPFWLAPLPKVRAPVPPAKMRWVNRGLRQMLGWNRGWTQRYGLVFLCVLIASFLCVWVVWIAFRLDAILDESTHLLSIAVLIIILACILGCIFWLRPDIRFGGYPEELTTPSKGRRTFLWVVGASMAAGLAYALIPQEIWNYIRRPHMPRRYTKRAVTQVKSLPVEMQNRFLMNKKSHMVHYIGIDDRILQRTKVKPQNLIPVDTSKLVKDLTIRPVPPKSSIQESQRVTAPAPASAAPTSKAADETERVATRLPAEKLNPAPVTVQQDEAAATRSESTTSTKPEADKITPVQTPQPPVADSSHNSQDVVSLEPKPIKKITQFPLREAALSSERLAIQEVNNGDIPKAIEVLWYGIRQDTRFKKHHGRRPSYRLYDLTAGLAKRLKNDAKWKAQVAQLRMYVAQNWKNDVFLNQRVNTWSNPSDKWKKKWEAQEVVWKHPPSEHSKKPPIHKTK